MNTNSKQLYKSIWFDAIYIYESDWLIRLMLGVKGAMMRMNDCVAGGNDCS